MNQVSKLIPVFASAAKVESMFQSLFIKHFGLTGFSIEDGLI